MIEQRAMRPSRHVNHAVARNTQSMRVLSRIHAAWCFLGFHDWVDVELMAGVRPRVTGIRTSRNPCKTALNTRVSY